MPSAANRSPIVYVLILIALIAYLFVSAPPPLPEAKAAGATVPVERVFAIVEAENDVVRALWTQEIVAAGKKVGLKFDEDWREAGVEAGPLPALFLRETAKSLEKHPVQLSLFLGSDFPIRDANRFAGLQMAKFLRIKATREPEFFFEPSTGMHTAMFSDTAVVEACIKCHNEHPQSPKNDWRLNDVMGATTWIVSGIEGDARGAHADPPRAAPRLSRGLQRLFGQGKDFLGTARRRRALAARGLLPARYGSLPGGSGQTRLARDTGRHPRGPRTERQAGVRRPAGSGGADCLAQADGLVGSLRTMSPVEGRNPALFMQPRWRRRGLRNDNHP